MEIMENMGTKIKEVPQSIIASYAIHWNIKSMIAHINLPHKRCSKTKCPMQNRKEDEAVVKMVLIVKTRNQNLRLVLQLEKEARKTKTTKDWEN
jgi:hypothetical protein